MTSLPINTADAAYYHGLQRASSKYDRFFYELIAPESAVTVDTNDGRRCLTVDLRPTNDQIALAKSYGVSPQMLCLDIKRRDNWSLADLSKEQLQV
jgi:hypothetical protein